MFKISHPQRRRYTPQTERLHFCSPAVADIFGLDL